MPIPTPNLTPPFNVIRLSHVELGVVDLEASRAFYVDTLGMQISRAEQGRLYLRALEERGHHSVVLTEGIPEVMVLGFKVWDETDLDLAEAWFQAQGRDTYWAHRPHMGRVLRTTDPWGVPLEFYAKMERLKPIHQEYARYRGVKPLRIDHFNMFSANVEGAVEFWTDMGFRTTEYTEDEESGQIWAAWLHRKGGVHDIAFTNGTGPRLHHLAFWTAHPMNIIDLLDLMATTGYVDAIERGPGRHGISNAFFLYVRDPDGHRVEIYSSDYQTIDPDHEPIAWGLKNPQRQTLWGAPAPRSWFEEGSMFRDCDTVESSLRAQPIIAP